MAYVKGIVCFIDILGTKEKTFDELLFINEIFHKELDAFQKSQKSYYIKKQVICFSDCAYIVYVIEGKMVKNKDILDYIVNILFEIANTLLIHISNCYLCRGGITYGELYIEKNRNIIFGPAVNEAYLLENRAKMPRIIIDDVIVQIIKSKLSEKQMNIIIEDIDKIYYLNYFIYFELINNGLNEYMEIYTRLVNYSKKIIKETKKITIEKSIMEKHNWHINFMHLTKEKLELISRSGNKKSDRCGAYVKSLLYPRNEGNNSHIK